MCGIRGMGREAMAEVWANTMFVKTKTKAITRARDGRIYLFLKVFRTTNANIRGRIRFLD